MNIYENLKMRLESCAFHEDNFNLTSSDILLILSIIEECERFYGIVRMYKHLITDLQYRIDKLEGKPVPDDLPFPEVEE